MNSGCQLTKLDQLRLASTILDQLSCQQHCISRILRLAQNSIDQQRLAELQIALHIRSFGCQFISLDQLRLAQNSLAANSSAYQEFWVSAHQPRLAQTSLAANSPAYQEFWVSVHQPRLAQTSLDQPSCKQLCISGILGVSSLAETSLNQLRLAQLQIALHITNCWCQLNSLSQHILAQISLAANSSAYQEFWVSAHELRLEQTSLGQPSYQQPCISGILGVSSLAQIRLDQHRIAQLPIALHIRNSVLAHQPRLEQISVDQHSCKQPCILGILGVSSLAQTKLDQLRLAQLLWRCWGCSTEGAIGRPNSNWLTHRMA